MTSDHQQRLDNIAEELFYYSNEAWVIKDLLKGIPENVSMTSPYLNFRDAMFHYKKMYDAANNNDDYGFTQQEACIEEHLNRGLKDFAIFICANYYAKILHMMIDAKVSIINTSTLPKLRHIYHEMKNIVVEIRIGGQTLQRFDSSKTTWLPNIVTIIEELYTLLDKSRALKRLFDRYAILISKGIEKKLFYEKVCYLFIEFLNTKTYAYCVGLSVNVAVK